jgi:ketosteroid isomerase-like protein
VSEESVEIVRATYAAMADGDPDAMLPFISEDFEMITPSSLAAEPDTYRGHAGVRRWYETFYEAVDSIRFETTRVEAAGERVALRFTMTTRGRTTGLEASLEATALADVEGGKVTRIEFFPTWEEAVAAAG